MLPNTEHYVNHGVAHWVCHGNIQSQLMNGLNKNEPELYILTQISRS